ncbi:MAG TPA: peptidogalycan biosysnthesis protein [Kofleriaceae bacterium]|nr:peptidogalycan biosysnthesis protein [Kofleriaceae bacterium]
MITTRVVRRMAHVDAAAWDALEHAGSPFLRYGFLMALEETDSIGRSAGWEPRYVLAEKGGRLVGAAAAFRKSHSFGEFIFDWEWAHASERAGLDYYPKLVVAAPVTPATGPRLLRDPGLPPAERRAVGVALVEAIERVAQDEDCSSLHFLFVTDEERELLVELGLAARASFQFHWHNRGYRDFDDYLARMSSRRRKQVRKERSRARAAVDAVELVPGASMTAADLRDLERFYRVNVAAHGGTAYLEHGFFTALVRRMPEAVLMARAVRGKRAIAGALFLESAEALYGRYWGATEDVPLLHFEVTCYLGIERCIERGTPLYEAGAQGSHKLLRGFEPSPTHSVHRMYHPGLDRAVRRFLREEATAVENQMARLGRLSPFKEDDGGEAGAEPDE